MGCESLTYLDLSNFNTQNVFEMNYIFSGCNSLTYLDISNFKTRNIVFLNDNFQDCNSLIKKNIIFKEIYFLI